MASAPKMVAAMMSPSTVEPATMAIVSVAAVPWRADLGAGVPMACEVVTFVLLGRLEGQAGTGRGRVRREPGWTGSEVHVGQTSLSEHEQDGHPDRPGDGGDERDRAAGGDLDGPA